MPEYPFSDPTSPVERREPSLPPPLPRAARTKTLLWPLLLTLGGVLVITAAALLEDHSQNGHPWRYALASLSGPALWEGTIPIQVRKLPPENYPESEFMRELRTAGANVEGVDLSLLQPRERLVSVTLPPEQWDALLDSGRVPAVGAREVLAGQLCRLEHFTIDGESYAVVGRTKRATAGFAFAYLIPQDESLSEAFNADEEGSTGWLDPEGQLHDFAEVDPSQLEPEEQRIIIPLIPAARGSALLGFLGIAMVAVGGAFLQLRLLRRFNARYTLFCDIIDPLTQFPRIALSIHVMCYGVYFAAGLAAFLFPRANLQLLSVVS